MCVEGALFRSGMGPLTAENDGRGGSHDAEEGAIDGVFGTQSHCDGLMYVCVGVDGGKLNGEDLAG